MFRKAVVSALHLFIVLFFFGAGLFCASLPYLAETRFRLIEILSHRSDLCIQTGLGFFSASLCLLAIFYSLNRGRYLPVQMGVSVDVKLIREVVEGFFSSRFSKKISLKEIEIGNQSRLQLEVGLASFLDETARSALLAEFEKELQILLRDRFGYMKPFSVLIYSQGQK